MCEDCHNTNNWVSSVLQVDHAAVLGSCASCHNGTTGDRASPADHIPSGTTCDDCHTTTAWTPACSITAPSPATAASCHNGTTAHRQAHAPTSRPPMPCARTVTAPPPGSPVLRVDHAAVLGTCFSCHNGTTATGKTAGPHPERQPPAMTATPPMPGQPAVFDHSTVTGNCSSCHNGTTADRQAQPPTSRPPPCARTVTAPPPGCR